MEADDEREFIILLGLALLYQFSKDIQEKWKYEMNYEVWRISSRKMDSAWSRDQLPYWFSKPQKNFRKNRVKFNRVKSLFFSEIYLSRCLPDQWLHYLW